MIGPVRSVLPVLAVVAFATAGFADSPQTTDVQGQVDQIFKAFTRTTPGWAVGADVKGDRWYGPLTA